MVNPVLLACLPQLVELTKFIIEKILEAEQKHCSGKEKKAEVNSSLQKYVQENDIDFCMNYQEFVDGIVKNLNESGVFRHHHTEEM